MRTRDGLFGKSLLLFGYLAIHIYNNIVKGTSTKNKKKKPDEAVPMLQSNVPYEPLVLEDIIVGQSYEALSHEGSDVPIYGANA